MATTDKETVWIAPLAYCVEDDYCFIYYSSKESRHSKHIKENNIVACSIYNSALPSDEVDGIQFSGKVEKVSGLDLVKVVPEYFLQSFPLEAIRKKWSRPTEDFRGLATQRFYRITPLQMFTIDLENTKEDKRIEVDLTILREKPCK